VRVFLLLYLWSGLAFAAPRWEVAVAFLGAAEDAEFQSDINRNVMELARLAPTQDFRLSLYRELSNRAVAFTPELTGPLHPLAKLLDGYHGKEEIQGRLRETRDLSAFLSRAFVREDSKRLLVIYGHGLGYDGFKELPLLPLRKELEKLRLDVLWLDACFMATLEVAAELRGTAKFLVASQESEFSSGAPFELFQQSLSETPEVTAKKMAERFLESYSFLRQGSQTGAVYRSSATISVIDLEKLEPLYAFIRDFNDELKQDFDNLPKKFRMEQTDLIDFGSLLQSYPESETALSLSRALELGEAKSRKTNPRLKVEAPESGSLLVFGFENWKRGNRRDSDVLEKLPPHLHAEQFVYGPNRRQWPARPVNVRLYLTPFTVGLNRFDYYFADPATGRPLTEKSFIERKRDYVVREARELSNPLRFSGYTQGVGAAAEIYTGLAVLAPGTGVANVDYTELRFFQLTGWANF